MFVLDGLIETYQRQLLLQSPAPSLRPSPLMSRVSEKAAVNHDLRFLLPYNLALFICVAIVCYQTS